MNDLANLRMASSDFLYRLDYNSYLSLENAYKTSSYSWYYLNSYRYESARYMDVTNDFNAISYIMRLPPPPPVPRVITVTGEGSGGTSGGDRDGACQRASDRALSEVAESCANQRGFLLNSNTGTCHCSKHPGSRDDYTCRISAQGSCQLQ